MLKKLLILISMISLATPVFAGEYETALREYKRFVLYMYTSNCGYCTKFNPIYSKLTSKYAGKCKFVKIDADTEYGATLMHNLEAYYVPYVVMVDSHNKTMHRITPQCLLNYACMQDAVDKFVN